MEDVCEGAEREYDRGCKVVRVIQNAETRLLDRYVHSGKMVHTALLLLMLEAANADLVSPSA